MPYATLSGIADRLDPATLLQLADVDGDGIADQNVIDAVIADADGLINGLLGNVYMVPIEPVPPVIREHSCTIAIYRLHLYRSVEPTIWGDAFRQSLTFLGMVGEGKAVIDGLAARPAPSSSITGATGFSSEERKFGRTKLGEW